MITHASLSETDLRKMVRKYKTVFGGNKKLKIYGTLHCKSGKRMKKGNRVFFISETEAVENGYRPCKHCMRQVSAMSYQI